MCPKRTMISLYIDGELPSPWKEKLEAHLESCPKCRAILAGYRSLEEKPKDLSDETIQAAQDRVWKKIISPALVIPGNSAGRSAGTRVWNRRITLPLPVAVAAGLAIIVAFFALLGIRGTSQSSPYDSMAVLPGYLHVLGDDHGIAPIQDMNSVLQYLSSQGDGDFMVVRLPESRSFVRSGEPALINAADYSRVRRNRFR